MREARRWLLLVTAVSAVGWAIAPRASACSTCACGDPTLTASGVERPYRNRVRLAIDERYGSFAQGPDGASESVHFLRTSLAASWSPHPRITVAGFLPWVSSWIDSPSRSRTTVNGLGDFELALRAVVFQERRFAPHNLLWAAAGLKFPTGYFAYDDNGYPVSDDDQPGSGSWDPFFGLTYGWFGDGMLSIFGSASGRITTAGWHGYRRGSSVGTSAVMQLQPWPRLAFQLGIDGAWQQSDTLPNGATMPNTGGTVGYIGAGALINPWRDLLVRLYADAPVLTELHGHQSLGPQITLQLSYDFN
jgi:hypothetical protein